MLDKIYEFAKTGNGQILPGCYRKKKIDGYIQLAKDGKYLFFEKLDPPKEITVPALGNTGSSSANIIIEKDSIILNDGTVEVREKDYMAKLSACSALTQKLAPVKVFLESVRSDEELKATVLNEIKESGKMSTHTLSFKIEDAAIESDKDICDAIIGCLPKPSGENVGISSITLETKPIASDPVKFKTPFGYDTSIAPFSKNKSTSSYYQAAGTLISHIGQDEIDVIKHGLETLLDDRHYNRFFRIMHWYDHEEIADQDVLFDFLEALGVSDDGNEVPGDPRNEETPGEPKDASLARALHAVENIDVKNVGNLSNEVYNTCICYAPCDSRYVIRNYRQWNASDISDNITKFRRQSRIGDGKYDSIDNLKSVLFAFVPKGIKERDKYVYNTFGSNIEKLVYAALSGKQIPTVFVLKAIRIAASYVAIQQSKDKEDQRFTLGQYKNAIKIIKIYLSREETHQTMTNAYRLGSAFAVYEKLQQEATSGSTVSNLFASAKSQPSKVFPRLAELSKHHLAKLKSEDSGRSIYFSSLLSEVYSDISEIPGKFSVSEQAEFILGYYQKNKDLYTKKEN